jgi:glycosyltransferase involved in cell wall biosynthesis
MQRALVVCHDVVGGSMAGPGIRYWELSAALARRGVEVRLAAPRGSDFPPAPFATMEYGVGEPALVDAARRVDALVVTGPILEQFPPLKALGVPIVVDMYDPFLFENLHRLGDTAAGWAEYDGGLHTLAEHVRHGDFYICANDRQRDLYVGMLAAWGRVTPTSYANDPTLEGMIAVVPFGLPSEPPRRGPGLRGTPGIGADDPIVVWNGGLWDWFDPDTAIRAVARLAPDVPTLRLVFLGTRHPNPSVGEPPSARRARRLADDLGLTNRSVFFREWTPYAERGACLLDAALAISLHLPGVETRYASRTRLLDCIWSALPVVTTEGDVIGDELARRGLARAVAPGDDAAAAAALAALLGEADARGARRAGFAELAEELRWDRVVEPLAAFIAAPRRRPSGRRPQPDAAPSEATPAHPARRRRLGWLRLSGRSLVH